MDDALAIEPHARLPDRLGIECKFQNVGRLDQLGRARARQQIVLGIARMAHADVPKRVEHALVGDHAVGERQVVIKFIQRLRQRTSPPAAESGRRAEESRKPTALSNGPPRGGQCATGWRPRRTRMVALAIQPSAMIPPRIASACRCGRLLANGGQLALAADSVDHERRRVPTPPSSRTAIGDARHDQHAPGAGDWCARRYSG
jgi:hypothetical protein